MDITAIEIDINSIDVDVNTVGIPIIPPNYIDTSNATATADNIFAGATAYVAGEKVTGTAEIKVKDKVLVMPLGLCTVGGTDSG